MRLLADIHVSPYTVSFVATVLGHDIIRVSDLMPASASDESIIQAAITSNRTVLTQDLDFSALMAISGRNRPSIITLRQLSAKVPHVNAVLERALPEIEAAVGIRRSDTSAQYSSNSSSQPTAPKRFVRRTGGSP